MSRLSVIGPCGLPALPDTAGSAAKVAALTHLLHLEADARNAMSTDELSRLMVGETGWLLHAGQVFRLARASERSAFRVAAMSGLPAADRQAPLGPWIEHLLARHLPLAGAGATATFSVTAAAEPGDALAAGYPFPCLMWVPLWAHDGVLRDGLLLAREGEWRAADRQIAARLAHTYGHALELLVCRAAAPQGPGGRRHGPEPATAAVIAGLAGLALALMLAVLPAPVEQASAEAAPQAGRAVAMPIDGVVERVLVAPGDAVAAGQPLVRLVDTAARQRLELATRQVALAEAVAEKAQALAPADPRWRPELAIARAELELRIAERDHAREHLATTVIHAPAAGIAVLPGARLEGRRLATGDPVAMIAPLGAAAGRAGSLGRWLMSRPLGAWRAE